MNLFVHSIRNGAFCIDWKCQPVASEPDFLWSWAGSLDPVVSPAGLCVIPASVTHSSNDRALLCGPPAGRTTPPSCNFLFGVILRYSVQASVSTCLTLGVGSLLWFYRDPIKYTHSREENRYRLMFMNPRASGVSICCFSVLSA